MATGSTIITFTAQIADVDRGVYEEAALRLAKHPSESDVFLVTRTLAYCLEYTEGIVFGGGISTTDEPAVLVRDLTGAIRAWIEVGAPDAERLHHGSRLADRTVVYTQRDPHKVLPLWSGKRIHRAEDVRLRSFDPGFIEDLAARLERRNTLTVSVTEGQIYAELNGWTGSSVLHEHPIS